MLTCTPKEERFPYLLFLTLALSKDPTRPVLQLIHVNAEEAVATDGHRMHLVSEPESIGLEPGLYRSFKSGRTGVLLYKLTPEEEAEAGNYPQYRGVIDSEIMDSEPVAHLDYNPLSKPIPGHFDAESLTLSTVFRAWPGDVNCSYIRDACTVNMDTLRVHPDPDRQKEAPLIFRNGKATALVMPCRSRR